MVWAGCGTYPLGAQEMQTITSQIADRRAQQHNVQKLKGPKPYSKHGY